MILHIELTPEERELARFYKHQYGKTLRQRIVNDVMALLDKTRERKADNDSMEALK